MHGRTKAGTIAALGCAAALLFAAPASAEITSVFSDTATPIDCEVLNGGDDGIRYCGSHNPGPATDEPTAPPSPPWTVCQST